MTLTGWATFTNPYKIFWGGIRYGPKPCVGRTDDRHYLSKFYIFSEAWITTQYFVITFILRTIYRSKHFYEHSFFVVYCFLFCFQLISRYFYVNNLWMSSLVMSCHFVLFCVDIGRNTSNTIHIYVHIWNHSKTHYVAH